jgi:hypothetical protein
VTAHGDDREVVRCRPQPPRRLHAVDHRHLDVHHDRVRPDLARELDGLLPVPGRPGNDEPLVLLEEQRDGVEERLVVFGDEDSERLLQLCLLLASPDTYPARR